MVIPPAGSRSDQVFGWSPMLSGIEGRETRQPSRLMVCTDDIWHIRWGLRDDSCHADTLAAVRRIGRLAAFCIAQVQLQITHIVIRMGAIPTVMSDFCFLYYRITVCRGVGMRG